MTRSATALFIASWLSSTNAAYSLKNTYDYTNFFDPASFTFYSGWDQYTSGYALYQSKSAAMSSGLASINNKQVYLGVDSDTYLDNSTTAGPGNGRPSVRLEGINTIDNGLVIADFDHVPASGCGQWPAFWLLHDGSDGYSEIDIYENEANMNDNSITLYTSPGTCTMNDLGGTGQTRGTTFPLQCNLSKDGSGGCGADAADGSANAGFNQAGGGYWATQVETDGIKIWYFTHGNAPADMKSANPDPTTWPKPVMNFGPNKCNMQTAFKKMKIIINITFCGPNAGGDSWTGYTDCQQSTGSDTCEAYVADNPDAFNDVYFLINSVKVFSKPQSTTLIHSMTTSTRKTSSSTKPASSTKTSSSSTRKSTPTPPTPGKSSRFMKRQVEAEEGEMAL